MKSNPEIKIRGYHTDSYGHVNNARYLEFLEEGRWTACERHQVLETLKGEGLFFLVVNINISYRRSALVGDTVEVSTGISKFGNNSATMHQEIILKGTNIVCAEADVTFVIADENDKSIPIEGEIRDLLEKMAK